MGSPPPLTSKKEVLKFRSVKSIVMAPAKTGRAKSSKIVVIRTLHANNVTCSSFIENAFILETVIIKFKDLMMEEAPAKCKDKIVNSTEFPE